MMSEECVAPRRRSRGHAEETEVVGVLIQDLLAVYKVPEKVVCKAAAKYLFVTFRRA